MQMITCPTITLHPHQIEAIAKLIISFRECEEAGLFNSLDTGKWELTDVVKLWVESTQVKLND